MEKLIENLLQANTLSDYEAASGACIEKLQTATEAEKEVIKSAMIQKANMELETSVKTTKIAHDFIAQFDKKEVVIEVDGERYSLENWVTLKEYCRLFQIKNTMTVSNWISRKIIPAENILNLRELNNLKLIRAIPYMQ